jgi:hypothetical protein
VTATGKSIASKSVAPFFLNGQYLVEGDNIFVGKNLQGVMSSPVAATASLQPFEMGEKSADSAGRCGACSLMGPCTNVPVKITAEILKFQQFKAEVMKNSRRFWLFGKINSLLKKLSSLLGY